MVIDAGALRRELIAFLEQHDIPDAAFDVRCMFEQVTGKRLETLLIDGIQAEDENPLRNMTQRRACGEPLQYILGEWEFYGMRMFVGKGVLIPRPETEQLVDAVLDWCKGKSNLRILDLCTGSGCIALALKKHLPDAQILGLEFSHDALAYAEKNAKYHHLDVQFHCADVLDHVTEVWFSDFAPDVIVSNPPYLNATEMAALQREVQYEPKLALDGGEYGMRYYKGIPYLWKNVLKPNGLLALEIGETQGAEVSERLKAEGFGNIRVLKDYAGHDRIVLGENFFRKC